ncbi:ATP-dependent DNA ligase [Caenimonas koreensis DSM 17982]|uniref:DNA ligase (ATP) n=1 Tax=Caenimonas koreensis DSM 17982 TaxID=1121255 RepID=A0A844AQ28_9BURK|nr:ATP-dependent DNA ligase [Caenimonas koreensis]MRD46245.1 ATP-dependent DNA ligase [Caenimonas koreensis DSM 17982]
MRQFAQLFTELDATTSTNAKVEALQRYFDQADARDAAWAVYFLSGGKPRQVVSMSILAGLACDIAALAPWLFDECYQAVGDLAETIAHILPRDAQPSDVGLATWVEERLLPLRGLPEEEIVARIRSYWRELDPQGRFLLSKLVGGGFRVGVSKLLVQRALAAHSGVDAKRIAQRMMGYTDIKVAPTAQRFLALIANTPEGEAAPQDAGQPYPFFLAHQLDAPVEVFASKLGPVTDWQVEWKYDGIRGQVVKRAGQVWVWSRGEELVTERFPEIVALANDLPDGTVLDGEILVWLDGRPAPFSLLQQRIGRKTLTKKILADAPVSFMAYDLLEESGVDVRAAPQHERRQRLELLLATTRLMMSPVESASSWAEFAQRREQSRELGMEGFMLKRNDAAYGTGRTKAEGLWWKWKIEPMTIDCVLIYAQAGHGRRASVYTDYTFAVWNREPRDQAEADAVIEAIAGKVPAQPDALQLVAFAKAYSGLTDEEFRQVDAIIRKSTIEKFGPVRSVKPSLVFELGFEGINRSPRHKSGIAVRFPRMLRIRFDKPLHEANTLEDLERLL